MLKPGLTDEHVTVEECSHWLARDTRASIRAASEVSNLESCRTKVNCLANDLKEVKNVDEEESPNISENELFNSSLISEDLPPRDCSYKNPVQQLTLSLIKETYYDNFSLN